MNRIRLAIVVEGETEEEFVKGLLSPHLLKHGVEANPHLLGGNVTVDRLASEMANYVWSYNRVTSFVDFYGFRDKGEASREDLQTRIFKRVDDRINRSQRLDAKLPETGGWPSSREETGTVCYSLCVSTVWQVDRLS